MWVSNLIIGILFFNFCIFCMKIEIIMSIIFSIVSILFAFIIEARCLFEETENCRELNDICVCPYINNKEIKCNKQKL